MEQTFNVILTGTFGAVLILTYIAIYKNKGKLGEYIANGIICILVSIPPFIFNSFIWKIVGEIK